MKSPQHHCRVFLSGSRIALVVVGLGFAAFANLADASAIYGTLTNFDVYNTTPEPCEGFEIELEHVNPEDITRYFPAHFNSRDVVGYNDGVNWGTRITYTDYHFVDSSSVVHTSINPTANPQSTNGHFAVNRADIEHFGFSTTTQVAANRFYWLDQQPDGSYARANPDPLLIANPVWSVQPNPVAGGAPIVRVELEVPEPEVVVQKPDSIWMKVYKTELEREVELEELMSGPGSIVPQEAGELEIEWELLEGGKMDVKEGELDNENAGAVIRRYEFFEYVGAYDVEHEPLSPYLEDDTLDPVALGEVGNFISANMVAINLIPEPASVVLMIAGCALIYGRRR